MRGLIRCSLAFMLKSCIPALSVEVQHKHAFLETPTQETIKKKESNQTAKDQLPCEFASLHCLSIPNSSNSSMCGCLVPAKCT